MFFDDWHSAELADRNLRERRAFVEFLEQHPEFETRPAGSYSRDSEVFRLSRRASRPVSHRPR